MTEAKHDRVIVRDLRAVRKLVVDGWTQGAYAFDRLGRVMNPEDPKAVRFSVIGAIQRVTHPFKSRAHLRRFFMCMRALGDHLPRGNWWVMKYNEAATTSLEDVLEWIDRTLRAATR